MDVMKGKYEMLSEHEHPGPILWTKEDGGNDIWKQVGFIQGEEEYMRVFLEGEMKFARSTRE